MLLVILFLRNKTVQKKLFDNNRQMCLIEGNAQREEGGGRAIPPFGYSSVAALGQLFPL
jgi:hypothetical protein